VVAVAAVATPTKKTGEAESRLQQLGNRLYGSSAANPGASTPAGRREAIGRRRLDLLGFLADYTGGTYHEAVDTTDVADAVGATAPLAAKARRRFRQGRAKRTANAKT